MNLNYFIRYCSLIICFFSLILGSFAANAQVKNPGLLVHAADDEPTTLDPAQVEPGKVEKLLYYRYMIGYWILGR